jgi:threonine dehydrogenase-like Zn-dependent dehydrogenase
MASWPITCSMSSNRKSDQVQIAATRSGRRYWPVSKGGRVSVPGVYGGMLDKWPLGAMMEKGLQIKSGQTHVQKYSQDLLRRIQEGEIDTTFLISHRLPLEQAPDGYKNFRDNQNEWTKVVLKPGLATA